MVWRRLPHCLLLFALCIGLPWPLCAQSTPASTLSVMTFNIRYGTADDGDNHWTKRREQLFDLLRRHAPDVVGLQEALHDQITEILAAVPGYEYVGVGRRDGRQDGEYAAILYKRSRLTPRRSDTFWFSDTPTRVASTTWGNRIERICTWAYFEDALGKPFYVYNVHLDHESQPSRERSVHVLLERIATHAPGAPTIVTGDFNAGESNPAVQSMKASLRDTFRVRHPDDATVGTFTGFVLGKTSDDKIDYVFASAEFDVVQAAIVRDGRDGRYPSDHFPVTATLRLP